MLQLCNNTSTPDMMTTAEFSSALSLFQPCQYNDHRTLDAINGSFDFSPREFTSPTVSKGLSSVSRFGHSSDFLQVFDSSEQRDDYLYGLIWIGSILAGLFFLWLVLILLFCCLGHRRVGFLSGKAFRRTFYYSHNGTSVNEPKSFSSQLKRTYDENENRSSDDGDDIYIEDDSPQKSQSRYHMGNDNNLNDSNESPKITHASAIGQKTSVEGGCTCCGVDLASWIRVCFIFSGICVIIFSVVLVTQGLTNYQKAVNDAESTFLKVSNVSDDANEILSSTVVVVPKSASNISTYLQTELQNENICPDVPDLADGTTNLGDLQSLASTTINALKAIETYADSATLTDLSRTLQDASKRSNDAVNVLQSVKVEDWHALIVLVPCAIISCFLVASAIMAGYGSTFGPFQCLIWWVVLPCFCLITFFAAGMSSAMLMTASLNSDFCYPHVYEQNGFDTVVQQKELGLNLNQTILLNPPDVTVLDVLEKTGLRRNTTEFMVASFYIAQCSRNLENPLDFVQQYVPDLTEAQQKIKDLYQNLNSTDIAAELSALCGREFTGLNEVLLDMDELLKTLLKAITDTMKLIRCDNIVPIYQTAVYDASCDHLLKSVLWIFSSTLVIAFFGFVMIMFRASMLETVYTYKYDSTFGRPDSSNRQQSAFHDENDDYYIDDQTRGGHTTYANDTVMNSVVNYEKNYMKNSN